MLLQAEAITLRIGGRALFQDASFAVHPDDRIGLVGDNGSGKSTLIQALLGEIELDRGRIVRRRGLLIGHVPQAVPADILPLTLHEAMVRALPEATRDDQAWRADVVLDELGLAPELWHAQTVAELSGGWQRLLLVARATLADPDLLILDEPTNHLDVGKVMRLERWLTEHLRLPFILVSHDREFLDRVTDRTIILRGDRVRVYGTSFSQARQELIREDLAALQQAERDEKEVERLERAAKRLAIWSNLKGHNPDMARRAKAVAARAEQQRARATVAHREARRDINLDTGAVQRETLVRLKDHVVRTETGRELLRIEQEFIRRGDRIALLGLNGTGKSHLIRDLMAAITLAAAGDAPIGQPITANPQLRPGYLDQHLADLPRQMPVNRALQAASTLRDAELVRELHNIGIPIEKQATPIAHLSYGEQLRVTFLLLRLRQPNIYLLDEPTNHLDIAGRERLEDLLSRDDTTCVFVTHDRRMLRGIGTRYLEIRNRRLVEVDGPDEFLERAAAAA
ncbi:ATP-binding cassette domain-containing protein [Inquilinus sp. Marseille-Q2685]|uniref:ATP-binding cassette domain-containing protein n=1 Tax=Inquilinus sp. Marseille-Q2685 TaxID=2866581 RepID=UPI001CE44E41|nr:ATP-binding cassette domain-containing protein [Inquilinus sp. Marseille-Q2685]